MQRLKPVMVWIHGGAYVVGSGSQASYSGANLVQAHSDIIMVTINYRLNMYGFMDFSSVPGGENFKMSAITALDFMVENLEQTPLTEAQRNALSAVCAQVVEEPTGRGFRIKLII